MRKWIKKLERFYNIKKVKESRDNSVNKILFYLFHEKTTLETVIIYREVEKQYMEKINGRIKEIEKEIEIIENR